MKENENNSEIPVSPQVVAYFRDLVVKFMGAADILVECTYCRESVPAWEALCVAQLYTGGIPAHFSCDIDDFLDAIGSLGIEKNFKFKELMEKVDKKMEGEDSTLVKLFKGEIEIRDLEN